jgi:hypothetical protein
MKYLPGLAWNLNHPISASHVIRIIGMSQWSPAFQMKLFYILKNKKAFHKTNSKPPSPKVNRP